MKSLFNRIYRSVAIRSSRLITPANKPKVIHSKINGYDLLVLANEDVGRLIHYVKSYEPAETRYLLSIINKDSICLDIGANIGYFTMLMAKAASSGQVHAFEPVALNLSLLKSSVELNQLTNVFINQFAVGDVVGEVSFSQSVDGAYSSMQDTGRKPSTRTIKVPVLTLDGYLDDNNINRVDVMKVDVEGAEGLVLAGASKLLADLKRRPGVVFLELYDQNLNVFGTSVSEIIEKMFDYGYEPFVLSESAELMSYKPELKNKYFNVFFLANHSVV